jgi:aminoglycoside 3-N-acetyltransferase
LDQTQARQPHSRASLADDLRAIGVLPGMTLIVHSAMSRIGWVISGAEALIWALMDVVGPRGTLVMPTFTGHLSDPASWIDPPAPAEWHERIRAATLPFHPALTRTRNMGQVPELFRIWPGAHRSNHPLMSLAAWGRDAASLVAQHPLPWALGDASPMGRCYERDSRVLLIGVGYERNSSFHLAETRAQHRRTRLRRMPVAREDGVVWEEHPDVAADGGTLFPRIGADFELTGQTVIGRVGEAETRLMRQRAVVDFATPWLDAELASSGG